MSIRRIHTLVPRIAAGALLFLSAMPPVAAQEEQQSNRIVMRVNNQILTLHDFERRKATMINTVLSNPRLAPEDRQEKLSQIGKEVMNQIFRELLLESHAKRLGMTITEDDIEASIDAIKSQNGIESSEQLEQALAAQNMTLSEMRENLRREMVLGQLVRREVTNKIEVPEDEIRAYYRNHPEDFEVAEERWLKEVIVLEASGLSSEKLKETATALHAAVSEGGDFAEVVASYQDQGVSSGIIDLGWLKSGELGEDLQTAAWDLAAGAFSTPVLGRGGYHIIQVVEVKAGELKPLSEVADQIEASERSKRFGTELRAFMARLEESSFIEEDLPEEAVGFRSLVEDFLPEDELQDFHAPLPSEVMEAAESGR